MDRILSHRTRTGPSTLAFHVSRIVIDAGVLISMAAMSMSFVTTDGFGKTSVAADALPVILLLAPVFVFTLIPDHSRALPAPLGWTALALGLGALPLAVVKYLDAANLAATLGGQVGFGARLLILGVFVVLVGIALGLARNLVDRTRNPARPAPPRGARTQPRPAPPSRTGGSGARRAPARTAEPNPHTAPTGPRPRPRPAPAPTSEEPPSGPNPARPERRVPPADPSRPGNG